MANVITFTDLAAPTGLAISATAGAGLANGTYYYKVIAVFRNTTGATDIQGGKSLASSEVSVVITTGNNQATLTWNAVAGAGGYRVYRTTTSGNQGAMLNVGLRDVDVNSGGVCTWIDTGIGNASNNWFQDIAHGKLVVSQTNFPTDVLSIVDLYNADVAGGWGVVTKIDASMYLVKAFIQFDTYITWKDAKKTIVLYDYFTSEKVYATFGVKSTYGSGPYPTLQYAYNGCEIFNKACHLGQYLFQDLNMYASYYRQTAAYADNNTTDVSLAYSHIYMRDGDIKNCFINKARSFQPSASTVFDRVTISDSDTGITQGVGTLTDVFIDNANRALQTSSGSRYRTVNYRGGLMSSADVLVLGSNWQVEFVDANRDVFTLYNSGTSEGSWVRDIKTFKYTVEDLDQNALENARVVIKNKNGTELFNDLTDASGVVETELYHRETTFSTTGVKTITDFNPFEITITKTGYETYYIKKDITAKVDETIALKKAVPLMIDNKGKKYMRMNKANQGNNRNLVVGV